MGTDESNVCFEWNELVDVFRIREAEEIKEEERAAILKRINGLADQYGRDYVIQKIALLSTQ